MAETRVAETRMVEIGAAEIGVAEPGVAEMLDGSPYQGYLYAYPHKTTYRRLDPRPELAQVWAGERREGLFLYLHVPFCEARCGYCNLFTRSGPPKEQTRAYVRQLTIQAQQVRAAVGPMGFSQAAIGGGTPTFLEPEDLAALLAAIRDPLGFDPDRGPLSVETSPTTATEERMAVLAAANTYRVSIGVQSFHDAEAHAVGRPQHHDQVERALKTIRATGFPVLNLDLIYGIPGQTPQTFHSSLAEALSWQPEEIYLYPLYVRPRTGIGRHIHPDQLPDHQWDAQRLDLYRAGRDQLLGAGYQQLSMRQFRRAGLAQPAVDYCCQDDGMIGLGCGARSYTRELHYSFDYAVDIPKVRAILDDYLRRDPDDFTRAEVGFRLGQSHQRSRWVVKSLLRAEGVDLAGYAARFDRPLEIDHPHLLALVKRGWARQQADRLVLTPEGLARSDLIGPWFVSADHA